MKRALAVGSAVAVIAALVTATAVAWSQRQRSLALDRDLREAEIRIQRLQAVKQKVAEFEARKRILEQKIVLIEQLRAVPSCPARILAAARADVDGVAWERSLVAVTSRPGSADATTATLRGLGLTILRAGSSDTAFGIFATVPPDLCRASGDSAPAGGGS